MSDLNITIKVFDRGIPDQIDAEDKFLVEYRDEFDQLQGRSAYLTLEEFQNYKEDRFSKLDAKERMDLIQKSQIQERVSVTWFRGEKPKARTESPAEPIVQEWELRINSMQLYGQAILNVAPGKIGAEYFFNGGTEPALLQNWEPRLRRGGSPFLAFRIEESKYELSQWLDHFESALFRVFQEESDRLNDRKSFWRIPDDLAAEKLGNRHAEVQRLIQEARAALRRGNDDYLGSNELSRLKSYCDFSEYGSLVPQPSSMWPSRRVSTPEFEKLMADVARKALTQ